MITLYDVVNLVSIEAALFIYIIVIGILRGFDDYSAHRNLNMVAWNDQHLNIRIISLENSFKKRSF